MFVILIGLHLHFSTNKESADRKRVREPLGSETKVLLVKVLFLIEMTEDTARLKSIVKNRFFKKKSANDRFLSSRNLYIVIAVPKLKIPRYGFFNAGLYIT